MSCQALPDTDPYAWQDEGICRTSAIPTDTFYPDPADRVGDDRAKSYCRQCPVIVECAEYGIANNEPAGVFGGLNFYDRKRIRSNRAKQRRSL